MPLPLVRALALIKRAAAEVNRDSACSTPGARKAIVARRGRSDRRQARRALPAGGLADRLRHADQHERQRGDREPRQRAARRQARATSRRSIRTITSTWASRRTTASRPRCTSRRRRRSHSSCCRRSRICTRRSTQKAQAFAEHRQDRPHPPAGRDPAHARPGILRLCGAGRSSASRTCAAALRDLYPLAQGGTAVGTGLNAHPGFAEAVRDADRGAHRPAVRQRAEQVRGARRARRDGLRARRAQHRRDRRSSRSPTTSACSAPARARASAN